MSRRVQRPSASTPAVAIDRRRRAAPRGRRSGASSLGPGVLRKRPRRRARAASAGAPAAWSRWPCVTSTRSSRARAPSAALELGEMPRLADAGIDERRLARRGRRADRCCCPGPVIGPGLRASIRIGGWNRPRNYTGARAPGENCGGTGRGSRRARPRSSAAVDRRAPVLAVRLRVLDLAVHAAAVLADGAFERDAAVRVDRVRRPPDERPRQAAVGRERQRARGVAVTTSPA